MKIRAQKREGNLVFIEVEEEYAKFLEARKEALNEIAKDANVPGFRQGKAPVELVEKSVKQNVVESQAAQNLISRLYPEIVDEVKVSPVDFPNVEINQLEKDKPFLFKITVSVYPEVKLGKYKGIKVEKKEVKVTEEDVLKVLGRLQERFAKTNAEGKKELLPLDDGFAKMISKFGTMAELKAEIRQTLLTDHRIEAEADMKNNLIAVISAGSKVDIPNAMLDREINLMLDELRTSLTQTNLTLEDYLKGIKKEEKDLRKELEKSAEMRVKGKVVLKAIAAAEKIKVKEEEIEEEIKNLARAGGQSVEEMKKTLDKGGRGYVEEHLLRRKALDYAIEKADIKMVAAESGKEEKA